MKTLFALFCLSIAALSISCTSSPKAAEYPKRYIDQPYTLPEDVSVWGTVGTVYYEKSHGDVYAWPYPIPIPLYWESSITDNVTLEIPVLPTGLRWRLSSTEDTEWGARFTWGFGYGSSVGLTLFPSASLYYKKKQDADHAWILAPSIRYSYYGRATDRAYADAAVSAGYLIQLNDSHAIQPSIVAGYSEYNGKATLPLELFYTYRVEETLQLETTYRYAGIGYEEYEGHFLYFILKKYF